MAWVALEKINLFLGNSEEAKHWSKRLTESGGEEAVAKEWIEALELAISKIAKSEEE